MPRSPAALALATLAALSLPVAHRAVEPGEARREPPWSEEPSRPFAAWRVELGTLAHLQGSAGWGQPWWRWLGVDAHTFAAPRFGILAARARATLPWIDLAAGWRLARWWSRMALAPDARHDAYPTGEGSSFQVLEAEVAGVVPTPGGIGIWGGQVVRALDAAPGMDVGDPALTAIVAPPWYGTAKLGWLATLREGTLHVGGTADAIFDDRPGPLPLRLGAVANWKLSKRWHLRGRLLVPIQGPDARRLATVAFLVLGWQDATAARAPSPHSEP